MRVTMVKSSVAFPVEREYVGGAKVLMTRNRLLMAGCAENMCHRVAQSGVAGDGVRGEFDRQGAHQAFQAGFRG